MTLVGRIVSVRAEETNYSYMVDDGTGAIAVKQWIEGDDGHGKDQLRWPFDQLH